MKSRSNKPSKNPKSTPKARSDRSHPTLITGESPSDERNANVQQSRNEQEQEGDPWGDQLYAKSKKDGEFTAGELGDAEEADPTTRGPLSQEGEGNRQNDELAELQEPAEEELKS